MQGSCKINETCPSHMFYTKMSLTNSKPVIKVLYVPTHVGHKAKLEHLTLLSSEKEFIAAHLQMGVETNRVLQNIQKSVNGSLERIHITTKQDIRNIEATFNINRDTVRNTNDRLSIESWVEEMKGTGPDHDPVLLYKVQDTQLDDFPGLQKEDFFLAIMNNSQVEVLKKFGNDCVIMDSTHGTNSYNFKLTTLMVLDENRNGFPCAFLYSSRTDEQTLSIFFKLIKEKAGPVNAGVFMTDDTDSFYSGWKNVMGSVEKKLLCAWHVDRSWRKNIGKVQDKKKQLAVYKVLRTLMEEQDENVFKRMLPEVLQQLKSDEDTQEFSTYFEATYARRSEAWAYCYRAEAGINTSMHIDSMHKVLKYIYLEGKKVKRLDKSIRALMTFLQDKVFARLNSTYQDTLSKKLTELLRHHTTSLQLSLDNVVREDEEKWSVQSEMVLGEVYIIRRIRRGSKECQCNLKCNHCRSCIHSYICSCPDNSIKYNMCKHIHLVCRSQMQDLQASPDHSDNDVDGISLYKDCEDSANQRELGMQLHIASRQKSDIEELRSQLLKNVELTILKIKQAETQEQLLEMSNIYKSINPSMDDVLKHRNISEAILRPKDISSFKESLKEPENKKIQKQGFYST